MALAFLHSHICPILSDAIATRFKKQPASAGLACQPHCARYVFATRVSFYIMSMNCET